MKIIIKTPDDKVNKFRLQCRGYIGKRFVRKSALLKTLKQMLISRKNFNKKIEICVKYSKDTINETILSKDKNYLMFVIDCFLEDFR
jgi:hypothetical protein